jgi:hypothetical protein
MRKAASYDNAMSSLTNGGMITGGRQRVRGSALTTEEAQASRRQGNKLWNA